MQRQSLEDWEPKTKLGMLAKEGKITIDEILEKNLPIREPEIVDLLVPDLEEKIITIGSAKRPFKIVQRMHDSGRRMRYLVMVAVGNRNGIVGIGKGKAKEFGPAINKALREAKMNIIKVVRGCGSWECACGEEHSIPYATYGRESSVRIKLFPAPKGTGLVAGDVVKDILSLAGIKDVWSKTFGHTKTTINLAKATFEALKNLSKIKVGKYEATSSG